MSEIKYMAGKEGIQELWRRIKAEIGKFTSFQKAEPAADGTPDIALADRKTNIIYLVPISGSADPDHFMEWIWSVPESADPEWVCIGDTSTDTPKYVDVTGTVSGTTQTVDLTHNRFARISIDSDATELVINVPAEEADRVGWFRFDFTLPEDTVMERVRVLDSTGTETLLFVPMRYPGPVTYKGEVIDSLAKIIGYPDPSYVDPLNPLGLPDYTIRVKFDTTDEPTFANGEATLVESSRGGWSIWDLTYESSDWNGLLRGQSHLVEVLGANTSHVTDMTSLFNSCGNLETIAIFDTSRVENMCGTFGYCSKLESIPAFDLTNVSNMSYAFAGCSKLKSFTGFNLPNLRAATTMFNYCSSLEDVSFDSSKITDFSFMFQGCISLVHGPDIDTSSAKTMHQMFDNCPALEDVPQYDTGKVTDFYETFIGCNSLNTVPSLDTSSAKTMELMFCNCSSLTEAPEMNTSTVENMKYMFQSCRALNTVPSYSTDSLKECEAMFRGSGITEVPNMDFSKVKVLDSLFAGCMNLTTVPMMNLNKAVSVNYMFSYCNNVEHGAFNLYASLLGISKLTVHVDTFKDCGKDTETGLVELEQIMTSWGGLCEIPLNTLRCKFAASTSPDTYWTPTEMTCIDPTTNIWDITYYDTTLSRLFMNSKNLIEVIGGNYIFCANMSQTFENCSNLTRVGKIITSNRLRTLEWTFDACSNLTSVELFDTSGVTSMNAMFQQCYLLTSVPKFDTSSVTNMAWMFASCTSLTEVPHFDTSCVTNMDYLFYNCPLIEEIPEFNTSSVTGLACTFRLTGLKTVPDIDTSNVTNMQGAFMSCTSLRDVPLLDISSATYLDSLFKDCVNVESGALEMYQQASAKSPQPTHTDMFKNCGRDTETGLADLEQIPGNWGGLLKDYIVMRFTEGYTPTFSKGTVEQISVSPNDWKLSTMNDYNWRELLLGQTELLEVLDMKATGITDMYEMFKNCTKLTTVHVLDTTSENGRKSVGYMFQGCSKLTSLPPLKIYDSPFGIFSGCSSLSEIPELDTSEMSGSCYCMFNGSGITEIPYMDLSKVTYLESAFSSCPNLSDISRIAELPLNTTASRVTIGNIFAYSRKVSTGMYAAYQHLAALGEIASSTSYAFTQCGVDTISGLNELNLIPSSWGGLAPDATGTVVIGGRTYKTITHNNKEWLAENLEYKFAGCAISTPESPITTTSSPAAWYYNNDEQQYSLDGEKKCGLLYNTYACQYLKDNEGTLLPSGWHIPSYSELINFRMGVAGSKAIDNSITDTWPSGYNGLGAYGFNVLPAGSCENGTFYGVSNYGYIYYVESYGPGVITYRNTDKSTNSWSGSGQQGNVAYSIRLVRTL
ncbi:MAG: BspA family leucine-rich repeat surface protein [Fibrobacter sp.]|nr:BspA family leucine-rich repeat surface protein [Fibrobacter sp.]